MHVKNHCAICVLKREKLAIMRSVSLKKRDIAQKSSVSALYQAVLTQHWVVPSLAVRPDQPCTSVVPADVTKKEPDLLHTTFDSGLNDGFISESLPEQYN